MYVYMYVHLPMLPLEFQGRGDRYCSHDGRQFSLHPYVPSGLFHPYHWEESISKLGCLVDIFFIFILFQIEIHVSKHCRSWSDATFCNVWSGPTLFALFQKRDGRHIWVKQMSKNRGTGEVKQGTSMETYLCWQGTVCKDRFIYL